MYETSITVERIKLMAKQNGIVVKTMLEDCGLNKNVLSSMQSRGSWLQSNSLAKIADYLNCSVDYLLGRTDNPNITADTYINGDNNNNGTQAINGSVSVTASSDSGRKDTLTEQFLQRFDSLSFEDKLAIMQHVQDIKKSPSDDGNK